MLAGFVGWGGEDGADVQEQGAAILVFDDGLEGRDGVFLFDLPEDVAILAAADSMLGSVPGKEAEAGFTDHLRGRIS